MSNRNRTRITPNNHGRISMENKRRRVENLLSSQNIYSTKDWHITIGNHNHTISKDKIIQRSIRERMAKNHELGQLRSDKNNHENRPARRRHKENVPNNIPATHKPKTRNKTHQKHQKLG
ncbi:MAG: hypothetical protein DRN53_06300 [Thermoprotei archaeon]|nr:MAG: hypothetical protein DRN53_06300 [Thermoprotei archaeon]